MAFNISGYTDEQLQTALDFANIDSAIALWRAKDWATYQGTRKALLTLIRSEYADMVDIPHLQFILFITSHLASRFPMRLPAWRMFTKDLPVGRSTDEPSWAAATSGDFLRCVI